MKSAIYTGTVRHRRLKPAGHAFSYKVFMPYLDLDELPALLDRVPAWSARRPALARFRRSDFLGDARRPLKEAVYDRVEEVTGERPCGPVRLLANLRYFGFIINPISCYYCFAEDGETLRFLVAEVTNTPWGESHSYVLRAPEQGNWLQTDFAKAMHVSPFHPMDMTYHWRSNTPEQKLVLHLANSQAGERIFDATLSLQREPATARNLLWQLCRYPFMTARVGVAIYWQALRLWLKGNPFYSHPRLQTASIDHE